MLNKQVYEDFQKEVTRLASDNIDPACVNYEAALRTQSAIVEYAKQTAQIHCVPKLSDNKQFEEFRTEILPKLFE